jgi:hypothetical protein
VKSNGQNPQNLMIVNKMLIWTGGGVMRNKKFLDLIPGMGGVSMLVSQKKPSARQSRAG